jgi:hypothetical protein
VSNYLVLFDVHAAICHPLTPQSTQIARYVDAIVQRGFTKAGRVSCKLAHP